MFEKFRIQKRVDAFVRAEKSLREDRGLDIRYGHEFPTNANITYSEAPRSKETLRLLQVCEEEMGKYSPEFLKRFGIERIELVSELKVKPVEDGEFLPMFATIDPNRKTLILDVIIAPEQEEYRRESIHHELFHQMEFSIFKSFYHVDEEWVGQNPQGFKYIGHGSDAHKLGEMVESYPERGFVSSYARYAIEEDRAETYTHMISDHLKPKLRHWIKSDETLARKVGLIKTFCGDGAALLA